MWKMLSWVLKKKSVVLNTTVSRPNSLSLSGNVTFNVRHAKKEEEEEKEKKSQLRLFSVAQFGLKAYPPSGTPCSRSSETDVKLSLLLRTSSSSSSLPPPLPVSALLPPLLLLGVTGSITAADIWRANRGLRSNQLRASCLPWTFRGNTGKSAALHGTS